MHEAYQVTSLLKLTVQVESIAAYDDHLLVGSRQGHLCMYSVVRNDDKCDVQLMRYNKSFSKKAIQQLEVIPDHHLLVSLTDNLVQVHDINQINFTIVHQVQKSRGATYFAINIERKTSLTGDTTVLVRMAVAVKRKIQLYYLKNNEFLPLMDDISLTEIPKCMVWCQESICIGYRGEYALLELNGEHKDLFPTSSTRANEPCIIRVSDNTFALCRECQTVLVNTQGKTERNKALKWSDVPVTLAWDEPYALGVLNDTIEVLTLEPSGLVQKLTEMPKVRFIIRAQQGLLYAASISQVWGIQAVDIAKQRKVLLDTKQFQLALNLTAISNESEDEKKEKIHQIQTLLAYDLFANKQFHDSMKEFLKLKTDPYDVIRLFPELLPQQAGVADYPEPARDLTEKELETGLLALIDYLTEMRHRHQSDSQANLNARGNLNERQTTKSNQQLLQIIDTTLLKCYLQTNDALVAPLLRLNHCHLGETEKILKKMGKHNELIILYQTKGQHRRALELLQADGSIERTVGYLQHLGVDNMGLILEFADWVIAASPEDGLKVYVSLIKLILDPSSCHLALPGVTLSPKTAQPDLELALQLLQDHAAHINPIEALAILPDSVPVARLQKFLLVTLHTVVQERRRVQLMKGLLYAEHLQCQELRLTLQNQRVLVTELNACPVCKKRFGNQSALVRYPNGDVVHFSCQEKRAA